MSQTGKKKKQENIQMFGAETGHTLNKMAADQSSVDQLSAHTSSG